MPEDQNKQFGLASEGFPAKGVSQHVLLHLVATTRSFVVGFGSL